MVTGQEAKTGLLLAHFLFPQNSEQIGNIYIYRIYI